MNEDLKKEQNNLEIDVPKAIEFILLKEYFKEFEVIDRLNQHPKGLNFYEWLFKNKLISKDKLDKVLSEISLEID